MTESNYDPVIYEDVLQVDEKVDDLKGLIEEIIDILANDPYISETSKTKLLNLLK